MAKKIVLSHTGLARVASGVPIAQVEHEEIEDAAVATSPVAVPALGASDPAAPAPAPGGDSGGPPVLDGAPADSAPAALEQTVPEMVSFLKDELASARTELATLQVEKQLTDAKLADSVTNSEGLMKAALHGAGLLQVMLGQTPISLEGLPASTVVAQYNKYRQGYEARYTVGQQSLGAGEATTAEATGVEAALKIGLRPVV